MPRAPPHRPSPLLSRQITEHLAGVVGAHPPVHCPARSERRKNSPGGGGGYRCETSSLFRRGMTYLAVVSGGRRRDRQGGGRARGGWEANLDDRLDFSRDSVAQACFSLALKLQLPLAPLYIPCQANGQFFHFQCMQSMLPSIPGNPLAAFWARIRAVSSALGVLKYCGPNTATTARQNL